MHIPNYKVMINIIQEYNGIEQYLTIGPNRVVSSDNLISFKVFNNQGQNPTNTFKLV